MFKLKKIYYFLRDIFLYFGFIDNKIFFNNIIQFNSKKANQFLKKYLKKSKFVFEYGSGNSTCFMEKNKINYISIEGKRDIFLKLKKKGLNVFYFSLGLTKRFSVPYFINFKKKIILNYVSAIKKFNYIEPDLVIIDGRFRVMCFFYIIKFLKDKKLNNTNVIIDDFDRKEYSIINLYFKINKVGRFGYTNIKNQKKKFNLKNIKKEFLFDPS